MTKAIYFLIPHSLSAMSIALVHDFLVKIGGAEKVLLKLAELYPKAPIYTLFYDSKLDDYFQNKEIIVSSLQQTYNRIKSPRLLLNRMSQGIEEFDFSDFDLIISSSHSFAKGIKKPDGAIHIDYCHSPTRWLWDSYHQYVNELFLPRPALWWLKNYLSKLRQWDFEAAQKVDYFIANSANVARRIKKFYRRDAAVIYPPVEVAKIKPQKAHQDYFLIISRLSPYKNVRLAVELFSSRGLPLKVIGEGEELEALQKIAGPSVEFLGFVDEDEKNEYLRNARAVIFPVEDDFGIVAVEAQAAGKPVIALGQGGALETVIPNVTGVFFKEPNVSGLEEGLEEFLKYEKDFNWRKIRENAERFSEKAFENKIKEFVKSSF
jgi:glycosyltransferase involved in cell wall biosynthesis